MDQKQIQDIQLTHSILNYVNAAFQGRYAFYNILDQLGYKDLQIEELDRSRKVIDKAARWRGQLWKDELIFSSAWKSPESFEAQNAVELLENLRPELERLAETTAKYIADARTPQNPEALKLLLGAFGRHTYSREHFVKGVIEFANVYGIKGLLNQFTPQVEPTAKEVERANFYIDTYRSGAKLDEDFMKSFFLACVLLPCIFRSHVHDINQIVAPLRGGFSFARAGIPPAEEQGWKNAGFDAATAGYWRAYGMGYDESKKWFDSGFQMPQAAAEWRVMGYPPELAPYWAAKGFNPVNALPWFKAGYEPDQAVDLIREGVTDPSTLNK